MVDFYVHPKSKKVSILMKSIFCEQIYESFNLFFGVFVFSKLSTVNIIYF